MSNALPRSWMMKSINVFFKYELLNNCCLIFAFIVDWHLGYNQQVYNLLNTLTTNHRVKETIQSTEGGMVSNMTVKYLCKIKFIQQQNEKDPDAWDPFNIGQFSRKKLYCSEDPEKPKTIP